MSTYGFLMQRERMTTECLTSMWLPGAVAEATQQRAGPSTPLASRPVPAINSRPRFRLSVEGANDHRKEWRAPPSDLNRFFAQGSVLVDDVEPRLLALTGSFMAYTASI
jgi:hypothetical protein